MSDLRTVSASRPLRGFLSTARRSPELIGATVGVALSLIFQFEKWVSADFPMSPGTVGTSGVIFGSIITGLLGAGIVWAVRTVPGLLSLVKGTAKTLLVGVGVLIVAAWVIATTIGSCVQAVSPTDNDRETAWVGTCADRVQPTYGENSTRFCTLIMEESKTEDGRESLCIYLQSIRIMSATTRSYIEGYLECT